MIVTVVILVALVQFLHVSGESIVRPGARRR
jgi:hypothetical protein